MNLRLDGNEIGALGQEFRGDALGRFRRVANFPPGRRDPVLPQQLSGLVFVDIHG
jgi:hypothetical protein